ncbi:MAG TPA: CDP-glucose 4,6-dehydratase [Candidatus Limnocylindria bacterium]|nr:CDP-glucose 4,6-dehydratase [Candidatus Limnocylindria bacterium]
MVDRDFWGGRSVFLTGHTGFKGGWLATWLLDMGARVAGYALTPDTEPSYFARCGLGERMTSCIGDVRREHDLRAALAAHAPEVVFHLAARSLVRPSYRLPVETFAVNVLGTAHLLEAARHTPSVRAVVVVTSDKCYLNQERERGYHEAEPLGGHDPYSASKAAAELVTAAYRQSFFDAGDAAGLATARAGNVIGGGDWAADRLVPDAVRALERGEPVVVRNPDAVRPWQHALEPLAGYLMLAQGLHADARRYAGAWNFGPLDADTVSVATLVDLVIQAHGAGAWRRAPAGAAPHEAGMLRLDCSKAAAALRWRPRLTLAEATRLTVDWYRAAGRPGASMYEMSVEQIRAYETRWTPGG